MSDRKNKVTFIVRFPKKRGTSISPKLAESLVLINSSKPNIKSTLKKGGRVIVLQITYQKDEGVRGRTVVNDESKFSFDVSQGMIMSVAARPSRNDKPQ